MIIHFPHTKFEYYYAYLAVDFILSMDVSDII